MQHEHAAARNRQNFAAENHGRPAIAATARPGDFSGHSAVAARSAGGEYHAPAMSPREARGSAPTGNRGGSNEGFRPFTPPNSSNSRNGNSAQRNNGGSRPNSFQSNRGSTPPQTKRGPAPRNSNAESNREPAPRESNHGAMPRESNREAAPRESSP